MYYKWFQARMINQWYIIYISIYLLCCMPLCWNFQAGHTCSDRPVSSLPAIFQLICFIRLIFALFWSCVTNMFKHIWLNNDTEYIYFIRATTNMLLVWQGFCWPFVSSVLHWFYFVPAIIRININNLGYSCCFKLLHCFLMQQALT